MEHMVGGLGGGGMAMDSTSQLRVVEEDVFGLCCIACLHCFAMGTGVHGWLASTLDCIFGRQWFDSWTRQGGDFFQFFEQV